MGNISTEFAGIEQTLQWLTIVAEQANEGVMVIDLNGSVHFANTATAEMHGYPLSKDLIGKNISEFHSEDQMNTDVFPMIEEAGRRGWLGGPVEHLRNDGTVFPTWTKMVLLKDAEDKAIGFIVFVTDITKRIQAENSLKKRNIELATANDHLEQLTGQVENLTSKLAAIEERLQQQTSESRQVKEQLQHQAAELEQAQEPLNEQASELADTNENLCRQVSKHQKTINQCVLDEEELRSLAELAKRLSN